LKQNFKSWPVRRGKDGLPLYKNHYFYFSAGSVMVVGYIVTGSRSLSSTHHLFERQIRSKYWHHGFFSGVYKIKRANYVCSHN